MPDPDRSQLLSRAQDGGALERHKKDVRKAETNLGSAG